MARFPFPAKWQHTSNLNSSRRECRGVRGNSLGVQRIPSQKIFEKKRTSRYFLKKPQKQIDLNTVRRGRLSTKKHLD